MRDGKNTVWNRTSNTYDDAKLSVLQDIRDELQKLNRVFECRNFLEVPTILREIRQNTTKPKRRTRK